jgi:hypothetical protein
MERSNGGVRKLLLANLARGEVSILPATAVARGPAGFDACA